MNELVKLENSQLEQVVKESGLAITEGEEIKQSYLPFLNELAEIQSQASKVNFENPTLLDEKIASELRKRTVKVRTGAGDLKDSRKRIHLLKGNLEQAAYNLIAATCKLTEETFATVEKAREIAERNRIAQLESERKAELTQFTEILPIGLGLMDESVYQNYIVGVRLSYEARIKAEQEAEAERLRLIEVEKETARLKAIEDEKIRKENEALKAEAVKKEKELEAERKRQVEELAMQKAEAEAKQKLIEETARKEREAIEAKAEAERKAKAERDTKRNNELRPYIVFIRDYSKVLNMDESEYQKELSGIYIAEKMEREFQAKKAEAEFQIEKAKMEERAKLEANSMRLEAELKAKKELELKVKSEADRIEKDRIALESKNAKAPEKEKLQKMINSLLLEIPELKKEESKACANVINAKFEAFKVWAKSQIESI